MNKFIEKVSEKYSIDRVELYSLYNESSVDILSSMVSRSLSEVEEVDLKSLYPEYVELKESNSKKVEVIDLKRLKKGLKKDNIILINNIFDRFYLIINDNEKYFETIQNIIKKIKNLDFLNKYEKNMYNEEDFLLQ